MYELNNITYLVVELISNSKCTVITAVNILLCMYLITNFNLRNKVQIQKMID